MLAFRLKCFDFRSMLAYSARIPHCGEDDLLITPVCSGHEIIIRDCNSISYVSFLFFVVSTVVLDATMIPIDFCV